MRTAAATTFRKIWGDGIATYGRAAPTVPVRDIAAALPFYRDVLGFDIVLTNGDPVGFVVLMKDAAEIHLSRAPGIAPRRPTCST
jgi:catechol 2,3-dioxygenase-like lactoylglutathione lyase family enzyme|nr:MULTISPECIES: VOC family protein [unclassified Sphingomonas]